MWQKHQIVLLGIWTATVGDNNELHYLLRWESMAERETKWPAFIGDPEWKKAVAESEAEGPLIAQIHNEFWAATDYSPTP
jgi:hypothetical protein